MRYSRRVCKLQGSSTWKNLRNVVPWLAQVILRSDRIDRRRWLKEGLGVREIIKLSNGDIGVLDLLGDQVPENASLSELAYRKIKKDILFETIGPGTVSYTHLDVYKRQALTCLSEEGEADVWALSDRDCRWVKDWFGARVGLDTMYIGGVTGPTGIKVSSKLGSATSAGGYNLAEIAKHKTPYVGDPSKAGAIIGRLPVPDTYFIQHYMFLRTAEKPYGLTAYYEPADDGKNNEALPAITSDPKIMATLQKNALVLFCMIDNVDDVTFAFSPTPSAGELNTTDYSIEISFSRSDRCV